MNLNNLDDKKAAELLIIAVGKHKTLGDSYKNGDCPKQIRDKLIEYYYPYSQKIANSMIKKHNWRRFGDDIRSSANVGLVRGVDMYKPKMRKATMKTYMYMWIKKYVLECVRESHWNIMRPPARECDKYMSGKMSNKEWEKYTRMYISPSTRENYKSYQRMLEELEFNEYYE